MGRKRIEISLEHLSEIANSVVPLTIIAKELGISRVGLCEFMRRAGVDRSPEIRAMSRSLAAKGSEKRRAAWDAQKNLRISRETLRDLYVDKGMKVDDVCSQLCIGRTTFFRWAHVYGLLLPKEEKRRRLVAKNVLMWDRHGATRRTISAGGYVHLKGDHPKATKNGYMREHRLVIEGAIGRCLGKDELVHHLNFNKGDNQITNLALLGNVDHQRFHHYMQRVGAYYCGWIKDAPAPIQFKQPAWIAGQWVQSFDAVSKSKETSFISNLVETVASIPERLPMVN